MQAFSPDDAARSTQLSFSIQKILGSDGAEKEKSAKRKDQRAEGPTGLRPFEMYPWMTTRRESGVGVEQSKGEQELLL